MSDYTDKVMKLLAKAEATEFEEERNAFMAKANQLMADHQITEAMIAMARPPEERWVIVSKTIVLSGQYQKHKVFLAYGVALAMGLNLVYGRDRNGYSVTVLGTADDLSDFEMMLTSLLIQLASELVNARPEYGWADAGATKRFRINFIHGFNSVVEARIRDVRRAAKQEAETRQAGSETGTTSVALALLDKRQAVEEAYEKRYGSVRGRGLSHSSCYGGGRDAGQAAGRRADIGQGRIGG